MILSEIWYKRVWVNFSKTKNLHKLISFNFTRTINHVITYQWWLEKTSQKVKTDEILTACMLFVVCTCFQPIRSSSIFHVHYFCEYTAAVSPKWDTSPLKVTLYPSSHWFGLVSLTVFWSWQGLELSPCLTLNPKSLGQSVLNTKQ